MLWKQPFAKENVTNTLLAISLHSEAFQETEGLMPENEGKEPSPFELSIQYFQNVAIEPSKLSAMVPTINIDSCPICVGRSL